VITNFDEMLAMLRYFDAQEWVDSLRKAPPRAPRRVAELLEGHRSGSDHARERALDDYFRRVQQANVRFTEEGGPGWLTDRGEVFISLGEPEEVLDIRPAWTAAAARHPVSYNTLRSCCTSRPERLRAFPVTPTSRAEFQRVLARVRRSR